MAYSGYRLKIYNTILSNLWISKGSYAIERNPRIAETYEDANGVEHDMLFPSSKAEITFAIREHDSSEHATIAAYFSSRQNVSVQYWDDNSNSYVTGTFKVKPFSWNHSEAVGNTLRYGITQITLGEY